MSILVKGIEMPKEKPLIIKISQDGTVFMSQGIYGIGHGVATAVPVPPHGRLIDADAMAELWKGCIIKGSIKPLLDTRPTVIEAEEGE